MKTGKVWRHVCTGMLAGGLILPLSVGANNPIEIKVTINNPQPTCNVSVPGTQTLKPLDRREQEQTHTAFTIEVNCSGNVKTKMKANATSGVVQGDGISLAVNMGGGTSSAGPFLKLRAAGAGSPDRFVKLRDSDNDWFCIAGTAGRRQSCSVTPVTISKAETPAGTGSATVAFTIDYFL